MLTQNNLSWPERTFKTWALRIEFWILYWPFWPSRPFKFCTPCKNMSLGESSYKIWARRCQIAICLKMTSVDLGGHFWPDLVPHFEGCLTTFILWNFLIGGLLWPEMAFWPLFWPFVAFKVDLLKLNIAYSQRRVKRELHAKFEVIWTNGVDFYKEHTHTHTHTHWILYI